MKNSNFKNTVRVTFALIHLLILSFSSSFGQTPKNLTESERKFHKTVENLCEYFKQNHTNIDINDSTIQRNILFDYVLKDSNQERLNKRISQINSLLSSLKGFVDSIGVSNLDAKPIRFYKGDSTFFQPFVKDLKDVVPQTFAYYDKRKPETPYGYLLFDKKTAKLISWILINQGGYYYFLTFNLI
jgi:hypothetical protein